MVNLKEIMANKTVIGLVLGQILSLLITSTGFSSSELARRVKLVVGNCFTFVFFNNVNRAVLEREELRSIHWSSGSLLPYTGFAAAMFLFYSGVPVLLKMSGSTMLNLSLLTSDMWFDKEKHVEVADEAEQSQCLDEEAGVACSNKSYLTASSSTKHESAESSSQKDKDAEIKKI
ncbi:solute carrier family 35 member F1-like protein [Tanacetum coccineum]